MTCPNLHAGEEAETSPKPEAMRRLKARYLLLLEEKMQLLRKLEERGRQLKDLREDKSTYHRTLIERGMRAVKAAEEERDKKVHELTMQLNAYKESGTSDKRVHRPKAQVHEAQVSMCHMD